MRNVVSHSAWTSRAARLASRVGPVVVIEQVVDVVNVDVDALLVGVNVKPGQAEDVADVFIRLVSMVIEFLL